MRNSAEQTVCEATSRNIDAQMRSLVTRRTREQAELRAQLQRLQTQQRLHFEIENTVIAGKYPVYTTKLARRAA